MGARISLGDLVFVSLKNSAGDRLQSTGTTFKSRVWDIDYQPKNLNSWQRSHPDKCKYKVKVSNNGYEMWVWPYELRRI